METLKHLEMIPTIAREDMELVVAKEKTYNASWKKRGGVGAYMVMIRKVDRLEEIARRYGYDIFAALLDESAGESLMDTVRDLRCYLDLIEAEVRTRCKEYGLANALTPKSAVEAAETVKRAMGDTLGGALTKYAEDKDEKQIADVDYGVGDGKHQW